MIKELFHETLVNNQYSLYSNQKAFFDKLYMRMDYSITQDMLLLEDVNGVMDDY